MDLKPLPKEIVEEKRTNFRNKILQVRARLKTKEESRDERILIRTCLKMGEYLTSKEKQTTGKVDSLIKDLHRSTISLQKRKQKLRKKQR
ncbi:hypothetical protein GF366_01765 [Candidatus Peregrinibacteria bacterium]|nr:hypothetical protein [Candidatus Peregrinibacteria bacterium]